MKSTNSHFDFFAQTMHQSFVDAKRIEEELNTALIEVYGVEEISGDEIEEIEYLPEPPEVIYLDAKDLEPDWYDRPSEEDYGFASFY